PLGEGIPPLGEGGGGIPPLGEGIPPLGEGGGGIPPLGGGGTVDWLLQPTKSTAPAQTNNNLKGMFPRRMVLSLQNDTSCS
ncbi:MAG: hypothetical protein OXJ56_04480, partial [Rhodospirillaceae bacterium]|nr:hypothetical protein [Rhodospirillaceae bacterium]